MEVARIKRALANAKFRRFKSYRPYQKASSILAHLQRAGATRFSLQYGR